MSLAEHLPKISIKWPESENKRMMRLFAQGQQKSTDDLLVKIVQEFKDESRKGIDEWRQALAATTMPETAKWFALQDLYDYLLVDTHAASQINLRKSATLANRFYVYSKASGQEVPEKTAILQARWFYDYMENCLDAVFRKYTVMQLTNQDKLHFDLIPRRNILPYDGIVLKSVNDDKSQGINYRDALYANTIIEVQTNSDYGLVNNLVPQILWKRNAQQFWAELSERFGKPMVTATTNKRDKKELDKIEAALKSLGDAATGVFPLGTTIDVKETGTKTDPYNLFNIQIQTLNSEMSKHILGGTMISDDGSSRSQSEVHQSNFDEKIAESDRRLIEFTTTDQLLPMLQRIGKGFTEDDGFAFDRSQTLTLMQQWTIVNQALLYYELDDDQVSKTFNLPIKARKPSAPSTGEGNFNKAATAMAAALAAKGVTLPNYKSSHKHNHPQASFTENLLADLSDVLINEIFNGKDTLVTEVLKSIASFTQLLDGLFDGWSNRIDISYDSTDVHCLAMMEYNLFEFSRLKEKANVFALNELLVDKDTNNVRTESDFINQAHQYLQNPDVNWLKTERNQSIAVGQNASRYLQFKNEQDTVTSYVQWQTVGDDRVRATHRAMEGKIFSLKDKDKLSIWPPKDWGCRCEMIQYLGKLTADMLTSNSEGLQILKAPANFNVNRGEIEQVFTANEMYLKSNGFIASEASELTYDKYKLDKIADITKGNSLKLDKSITTENVKELFKGDANGNMPFEDYKGRKFILTQSNFETHTSGKYVKPGEDRQQLFPFIDNVLKSPDEVYIFQNSKKQYQTNYIKYYDGKALAVNTQPFAKTVEINSWFYVKDEKSVRSGYLVYQNKKS